MKGKIETEGVRKLLKISDALEKNKEVSKKVWDDLFSTPGYKVLCEIEFSKEEMINNFVLVFMPTKINTLIRN